MKILAGDTTDLMMPTEERPKSPVTPGVWVAVALLGLGAIVLIRQYSPFVPDYDGLLYFDIARTVNGWLFGSTDYRIWTNIAERPVSFWPISNAPSVYLTAIFMHVMDPNTLPALINTLYLAAFSAYLIRIRSPWYALVAIVLLCGHTLFFRLFTTLTSEFGVGLWIFAFLATLVTTHRNKALYLSVLTILGLLLRTIDLVFIMGATIAYSGVRYALWPGREQSTITVRSVGLTVLLTLPLFLEHYRVAFDYVYSASFGPTSDSWKSLGGISSRSDVILRYAEYLHRQNSLLLPGTLLMVITGFLFRSIERRWIALLIGISGSICLPLVLASSLNVQVVFWVFASLIFLCCEIGQKVASGLPAVRNNVLARTTLSFILVGYGVLFSAMSWAFEVRYLNQEKALSDISQRISSVLAMAPGTPIIASNYRGVGPLDALGLAFNRGDKFGYGGINDIYSKGKSAADYLQFTEDLNFFITAHENYFFPPHFGINDHVAEIYQLMQTKADELGFRNVSIVARGTAKFDLWYRPNAHIPLQYAAYGDSWISHHVPLIIGSPSLCREQTLSGKIRLSLDFPQPAFAGSYTPPFRIDLVSDQTGAIHSSASVQQYGRADVALAVSSLPCGDYRMHVDKSFTTAQDKRALSAMYVRHTSFLKFDPAKR